MDAVPIALFVGSWLPFSETFVYEQLRLQRVTKAWVIAGARTPHASRFPYEHVTHLGPLQRLGYRYLGVAPTIERVFRDSGARLVFAHFGLNGAFALPFARRAGLPLAVMFHGHDVGGLLPRNRLTLRYHRYQSLSRELFAYAGVLLCASAQLSDQLRELGAPREKLVVHRLGIDVERFAPASPSAKAGHPTLLMVGRLVEKKGMRYGIEAFAKTLEQHPLGRLRIVGDGPLKGQLAEQARDLGVAGSVDFVGSLDSAGVLGEMQRAHVLLTPSVTTASGDQESGVLVLKEAAATGLVSVGTRHGGIPEIIDHGQTGLLVGERSVSELEHALAELLGDPALCARMGRAARAKMIAEYDARKRTALLEERLLELL